MMSLSRQLNLCFFVALTLAASLGSPFANVSHAQETENPRVLFKTSAGNMTIELFAKEAPISTKNFLEYSKSGFFEGTIFHRIIPTFVIQGGGFTKDAKKKDTKDPIKNEASNGLKNEKYTLSMARTGDPDSATSQFFVNTVDNPPLDREYPRGDGYGYAVFGKVVEGQEVVDKIAKGATKTISIGRQPMKDWPVEPIIVEKVEVLKSDDKSK